MVRTEAERESKKALKAGKSARHGRKRNLSVISGLLLFAALFPMGCDLSESHEGGHTDTTDTDTTAHAHGLDAFGGPVDPVASRTKAALVARGKAIYEGVCIHCHQDGGAGMPGAVPPLANSDFLMADRKRPVGILLMGLKGEVIVNGETYYSEMPAVEGSDLSIAAVLTYVRNQFNGATDSISVDEAKQARKELGM